MALVSSEAPSRDPYLTSWGTTHPLRTERLCLPWYIHVPLGGHVWTTFLAKELVTP